MFICYNLYAILILPILYADHEALAETRRSFGDHLVTVMIRGAPGSVFLLDVLHFFPGDVQELGEIGVRDQREALHLLG